MADRAIANRWAKAFIELAQEHRAVDKLGEDLQSALNAMQANNGQLFDALSNPVFTTDERRAVLDAVLPKLRLYSPTRNLLHLLLDKGRFALLPEIDASYHEMADDLAGRTQVTVQTAEPMSPQIEAEVRAAMERVTGLQVTLNTQVRPDLIGGIVARVGSRVYDASLRTRLENVKQALLAQPIVAEA